MHQEEEHNKRRSQSGLRKKFSSISDQHKFMKWLEGIKQERLLVQAKLILLENQ